MGADITLSPVGAVERGGKTILTAEVDGIFDRTGLPDPFLMDLYFTIDENLITALNQKLPIITALGKWGDDNQEHLRQVIARD